MIVTCHLRTIFTWRPLSDAETVQNETDEYESHAFLTTSDIGTPSPRVTLATGNSLVSSGLLPHVERWNLTVT